jgi:hypothetical protein
MSYGMRALAGLSPIVGGLFGVLALGWLGRLAGAGSWSCFVAGQEIFAITICKIGETL